MDPAASMEIRDYYPEVVLTSRVSNLDFPALFSINSLPIDAKTPTLQLSSVLKHCTRTHTDSRTMTRLTSVVTMTTKELTYVYRPMYRVGPEPSG